MQVTQKTARNLGYDRDDPKGNVYAGTKLLGELLTKYNGNVDAALADYNGGEMYGQRALGGRAGSIDPYGKDKENDRHGRYIGGLYKDFSNKEKIERREFQREKARLRQEKIANGRKLADATMRAQKERQKPVVVAVPTPAPQAPAMASAPASTPTPSVTRNADPVFQGLVASQYKNSST